MDIGRAIRRRMGLLTLGKVARRVSADRLTYLPVEKLRRVEGAIKRTFTVPGDILEFGVALGGSGIILAHDTRPGRHFHGFDVFGMIPPPLSSKDDARSKERYEIIRSGQSKGIGNDKYYGYRTDLYGDVIASFAHHGVGVDNKSIILHKGLFEDTWPAAGIESAALVHIDCDWYDPVLFCLNSCAEILSHNGLIVIDDYNDYGGCRTAVDEFLAHHSEFTFEPGLNPILWKNKPL